MKRNIIIACLLLGGIASAATVVSFEALAKWFKSGIFIGNTAANSTTNKITGSYAGAATWDFPAYSVISGVTTTEAVGIVAVTGAKIGDSCEVSNNSGMDGGALLTLNAGFSCRVNAAGFASIRATMSGINDAGVVDLPDAGYFVRTWSNQ